MGERTSSRAWRLSVQAALVAVLVTLVLWLLRAPASAPTGADAGAGTAEVRPAVAPPGAPPGGAAPTVRPVAPSGSAPEPTRHELLRPSGPTAATPRPIGSPPPGRALPVDRRGGSDPRAQHQLEVLSYAFETLDEDIQACLDQWPALDPGQTPEVLIGFELDATGLTRSYLEDAEQVPFGARTCLANAVHGLDWAHLVDRPALVTKRFTVTGRDAGP